MNAPGCYSFSKRLRSTLLPTMLLVKNASSTFTLCILTGFLAPISGILIASEPLSYLERILTILAAPVSLSLFLISSFLSLEPIWRSSPFLAMWLCSILTALLYFLPWFIEQTRGRTPDFLFVVNLAVSWTSTIIMLILIAGAGC